MYVSDTGETRVNKSDMVPLISINGRQVKEKSQRNKRHLVCCRNHQRANMAKDEVGEGPYQAVPLRSLEGIDIVLYFTFSCLWNKLLSTPLINHCAITNICNNILKFHVYMYMQV